MLQESPLAPHIWLLISNAITGILTFLATIIGLRFKQKKESADVAKTHAETRSIHVTSDISLSRELQSVVDKAEARREEYLAREEQLRKQVLFWRNKAEEIDGQLADAQETIWQMQSEMKNYENQIVHMKAMLTIGDTNYDNTKHLPIQPIDKLKE